MISADRIMGFIEGEACFGVGIQTETDKRPRKTDTKKHRIRPSLGYRVRPSFRVSLARKDREILDELQKTLEVGCVYSVKNQGNRSDMCQYAVQNTQELLKLIDFFDQQKFYTTKGASYQIWKKIVQMVDKKDHLSKSGFLEICVLREKMNLIYNKETRLRTSTYLSQKIAGIDRNEREVM